MFKHILYLFLLGIGLSACGSNTQNKASHSSFAKVEGQKILAPDGSELKLKGMGLGNWLLPEGYMFKFKKASHARQIYRITKELLGPDDARIFWERFRNNYITEADIRYMHDIGLNSIRVPFDYKLFTPENYPDQWIGPGFEMLDRVIGWASKYDMYVILDMHAAPGGQNGENIDDGYGYPWLYKSERSQQRVVDMWREIAARYKDEPAVLGYDLLNEPLPHFKEYRPLDAGLEPLYKRIVKAVREVDSNHIIILEGSQWDTDFKPFGAPFDDKVIYEFHKYWTDPTVEQIQPYLDYRNQYDVPLWLGESGENTDEWVADFRSLQEEHDIGWCFWPYKKMESERGIVSIKAPEGWDQIQQFAESIGQSYEERRKIRPDFDMARRVFDQLLDNIKLENTRSNPGYIKALGLDAATIPSGTNVE